MGQVDQVVCRDGLVECATPFVSNSPWRRDLRDKTRTQNIP